jgi:hypothetical protein
MRVRSMWCVLLAACALPMLLGAQGAGQPDPKDGWIPLFNGKDLTGWKAREADKPNGWKVVDGVYVNAPPSVDILTDRSFDDFDLYVEFKPAERTNSGLYLRDIYEVQILNSHGRPLSENMCGALYRRLAPKVNACRPAGEWQTFELSLVGRRLTVVHNGQQLHDAVDVGPMGTGNASERPDAPGPLRLQGDHQEIAFRNLWIRPRTRASGQ